MSAAAGIARRMAPRVETRSLAQAPCQNTAELMIVENLHSHVLLNAQHV